MKAFTFRTIALGLVSSLLLPVLVGCGKSEKAMQTPTGLSARQIREQKQGTTGQ